MKFSLTSLSCLKNFFHASFSHKLKKASRIIHTPIRKPVPMREMIVPKIYSTVTKCQRHIGDIRDEYCERTSEEK